MPSFNILALIGAIIWLIILLLPWRPYSTKECLDVTEDSEDIDLSDITVVIPARNESKVIKDTLMALAEQGKGLKIILVDDESTDGTSDIAKSIGIKGLKIVKGKPLPEGWTGKIWAMEQGLTHVKTSFTLFIDADILLKKGIIRTLKRKSAEGWDMVSLMAVLSMKRFWEKLLIPSFVYFFKLLYPFSLCNKKNMSIAAAAGGCMFVKTKALKDIGGLRTIKDEIIDDCALAKRIKQKGYSTWIGLTHSVISRRTYDRLSDIWNMVARSAFTQLKYSFFLLMLCTLMMIASFLFPLAGFLSGNVCGILISLIALSLMAITYIPVLDFYNQSRMWIFTLPFTGLLYLMMTWTSAIRYLKGKRSEWKGRIYFTHNTS